MFYRLGSFCARSSWLVCVGWLLAGVGLTAIAPAWDTQTEDDDVRFVPERFTSVRAYQLLEKAFPEDVFASRVVFAFERDDGSLTSEDFQLIDQLIRDIDQFRADAPDLKIGKVDSYNSGLLGWRMVSPDQQCTLVQVSLGTPFLAISTMQAVERMTRSSRKVRQRPPYGTGPHDRLRRHWPRLDQSVRRQPRSHDVGDDSTRRRRAVVRLSCALMALGARRTITISV